MLGLVTLVSIALGWHTEQAWRQRRLVTRVNEAGGWVAYNCELDGDHNDSFENPPEEFVGSKTCRTPQFLLDLLGRDWFHNVRYVSFMSFGPSPGPTDVLLEDLAVLRTIEGLDLETSSETSAVTDEGIAAIAALDRLRFLSLRKTQTTDRGVRHLRTLDRLVKLDLSKTSVRNRCVQELQGLSKLSELWLEDTAIDDDGLMNLQGFAGLETLYLMGTGITDHGVVQLQQIKTLRWVNIENTKVTDLGLAKARQAMPDCVIGRGFDELQQQPRPKSWMEPEP